MNSVNTLVSELFRLKINPKNIKRFFTKASFTNYMTNILILYEYQV